LRLKIYVDYPGMRVSTSSRAFAHTQIQYKDVNPKNAIAILIISINLQF